MNFSITGAHRQTGDDVAVIIPARNRAAAEKWASDNGILWTRIALLPPPMIATRYRAVKDRVVWLIAGGGILFWFMLAAAANPGVFSITREMGSFVACLFLTIPVVLLAGVASAGLLGKTPGLARAGSAVAAGLAAILMIALTNAHIHQQELRHVSDSARLLIADARSLSPHLSATPRPGPRDPSLPSIKNMSSSQIADENVVMGEMRKFVAEAKPIQLQYKQRSHELLGPGVLGSAHLDSVDHIEDVKRRLAQFKQLVDAHTRTLELLYSSLETRIEALPIGADVKGGTIEGYRNQHQRSLAFVHQMADTERSFVSVTTDLANFMEERLGHFKFQGKKAIFANGSDVAQYNQFLQRIREIAQKERELMARQQAYEQESIDNMQRVLGSR